MTGSKLLCAVVQFHLTAAVQGRVVADGDGEDDMEFNGSGELL